MERSLAEFGGCFALCGGFLADIRGEGDDADEEMPFVWIPGGMGRLGLVATFCCAATGAMFAVIYGRAGRPEEVERAAVP